jgi:hypothetical protein
VTDLVPVEVRRSLQRLSGSLAPQVGESAPVDRVLRGVELLARSDPRGEAELRAAFQKLGQMEVGLSEGGRGRLALETLWSPAVLHRLHLVANDFVVSRGVRRELSDLEVPTPWAVLGLLAAGSQGRADGPVNSAKFLSGWAGNATAPTPTHVDATVLAALLSTDALQRSEVWHTAHGLSDRAHLTFARWIADVVIAGHVEIVPPRHALADAWMGSRSLRGVRRSVARRACLADGAVGRVREPGWLTACAVPPSRGQAAMAIEWFAAVIRGRQRNAPGGRVGAFSRTPSGRGYELTVRSITEAAEAAKPAATSRQSLLVWLQATIDADIECDDASADREEA